MKRADAIAVLLLVLLAVLMALPLFVVRPDDEPTAGRPMPSKWDPVARAGSVVVPD